MGPGGVSWMGAKVNVLARAIDLLHGRIVSEVAINQLREGI